MNTDEQKEFSMRVNANRIKAGEAVGDDYIYGGLAAELLKIRRITENDLRPYRSSMFFADRSLHGEDIAKRKEGERKAKHDAALYSRGLPLYFSEVRHEPIN